MRKTVVECVYEHAKATPDKTAVIVEKSNRQSVNLKLLTAECSNTCHPFFCGRNDSKKARHIQILLPLDFISRTI